MDNEVSVRAMSDEDSAAVAAIYRLCFPETLLARYGTDVVACYHRWLERQAQDPVMLVGIVDGQVGGYCLSGVFQRTMNHFILDNAGYLALKSVRRPGLLFSAFGSRLRLLLRSLRAAVRRAPAVPPAASGGGFRVVWLAVHPAFRRRGIGERLIQATEAAAAAMGHSGAHLRVAYGESNPATIRMLEKLGWRKHLDAGVWHGRMVRDFNAHPAWDKSGGNASCGGPD